MLVCSCIHFQLFMTCIIHSKVLVVDQDNYMVIITSFEAHVMYYWVDVGNYIELQSVSGRRRHLEIRTGFKLWIYSFETQQ